MRQDAPALDDFPHRGFIPLVDRPPMVDVPLVGATSAQIATVRLELTVLRACLALLSSLAREHECLAPGEDFIVRQVPGPGVDLQTAAAPANRKIRGHLGELQACAQRAIAPHRYETTSAVRNAHRRCGSILSVHLGLESTATPAESELHTKVLCNRLAVGLGHWPVHEGRPLPAINQVVVQFDLLGLHTHLHQMKQACQRVFTTREEDKESVVDTEIDVLIKNLSGFLGGLKLWPEHGLFVATRLHKPPRLLPW